MIKIGTLELLKNLTNGLTENEYILLNNETLTSLGPSGPVLPGLPLTQFLSLYFFTKKSICHDIGDFVQLSAGCSKSMIPCQELLFSLAPSKDLINESFLGSFKVKPNF